MITEKEQNATLLSPVKKDFYQIWNELLETSRKLSERWDPTSTNESDPGIILLKVLTACSDKLNYNIDKNILEAFMPSAAQEESMRKLCDLLGYSMQYYKSATTTALISYTDETDNIPSSGIYFPKYTNLKNTDETVNYVTLNAFTLSAAKTSEEVDIIEGSLQQCATETDNIITASMLDDNFRYNLPESTIAENGIFVYNISDSSSIEWERVSNLNTIAAGKKVYKFGFNSRLNVPYVQFPEDVNNLIEDGLTIYYIRTNGVNGNISARTLTTFEKPELWTSSDYKETYANLTTDMFYIVNPNAATNGKNKETLNQAYNNYKKTIGTFDTLITCRDYINKIYQLTYSENNTTPLVSNIVVSDIKDDINRAVTLCTFSDYGIKYIDKSLETTITRTAKDIKGDEVTIIDTESKINNFDLLFYPFKTVTGLNTKSEYKNSFTYNTDTAEDILIDIEDYKTLSHNIKFPDEDEIVCIKNYLKLNAKITTTAKVNSIEAKEIIAVIKTAIYENFNARNIDFGEEIPYESILEVIDQADERIKNVSLDEPILYTAFELADGSEYSITSPFTSDKDPEGTDNKIKAKEIYNKLALRNILAGRIALFNYDKNFSSTYEETKVDETEPSIYPADSKKIITKIEGKFNFEAVDKLKKDERAGEIYSYDRKLKENEVLQFRSPNLKTIVTYPAYVNYYIRTDREFTVEAVPAIFQSLAEYFTAKDESESRWNTFIDYVNNNLSIAKHTYQEIKSKNEFDKLSEEHYGGVFEQNEKTKKYYKAVWAGKELKTYVFEINNNIILWRNWAKENIIPESVSGDKCEGLYRQLTCDFSRQAGKYVDSSLCKYMVIQSPISTLTPYNDYYIPIKWGIDGNNVSIAKNTEYQLKQQEYLLINYTNSETNSETNTTTETIINKYYGPGTIIKVNFDIINSSLNYELGNKYSKTDGFSFKGLLNSGNSSDTTPCSISVNGLYTLGTNEQIEIREPVVITLNDKTDPAYIYFIKNNNTVAEDGNVHLFETADSGQNSYILKANEYFFYTDKNKLDIAYYGNGTEIIGYGNVDIKKNPSDDEVSEQEISENGLSIIPWVAYHFTGESYVEINEYQYISLTEGDTIVNITNPTDVKENTWTVDSAEYKFSGAETTEILPAIEYKINGKQIKWELSSKLQLNAGPVSKQTLHEDNALEITYNKAEEPETTILGEADKLISFKTNYYALSGAGEVATTNNLYNGEGILVSKTDGKTIEDFKVKVYDFKEVMVKESSGDETAPLNNFGTNNWTKLIIPSQTVATNYTTLHLNIPYDNAYSLIMFYFIKKSFEEETSTKTGIYLQLTNNVAPEIFNNNNNWWTDHVDNANKKYYLKDGINIVKIKNSCDIKIYSSQSESGKSDTLIFSNPDIVLTTETNPNGINIDTLKYYDPTDPTDKLSAAKLLEDILKIDSDHKFYYNNPIDNSTALEVNTNASPAETLATETIWYDYNNINNKFVISEIDSDYLDDGITIAKSSRLY